MRRVAHHGRVFFQVDWASGWTYTTGIEASPMGLSDSPCAQIGFIDSLVVSISSLSTASEAAKDTRVGSSISCCCLNIDCIVVRDHIVLCFVNSRMHQDGVIG